MEGVQCLVCAAGYDYAQHTPLVYSCGHTICAYCTISIKKENVFSLICPVCRSIELKRIPDYFRTSSLSEFLITYYSTVNTAFLQILGHTILRKPPVTSEFIDYKEIDGTKPKNSANLYVKQISNIDQTSNELLLNSTKIKDQCTTAVCDIDHCNYEYELQNIDKLLSQITHDLDKHLNSKLNFQTISFENKESEDILSEWLEEDDVPLASQFWASICKTHEEFNSPDRSNYKDRENKKLQKEEEKLNTVPKTNHVTDVYNLTVLDDIVKEIGHIYKSSDRTFYCTLDACDQKWSGLVKLKESQYYFHQMSHDKPPEDAVVLKMESFSHLLNPHFITFSMEINIEEEMIGVVFIRIFGDYDSFQKITNNFVWKIANFPLHFDICEKSDAAILRISNNSDFKPLLSQDLYCSDNTKEVVKYLNNLSLVSINHEQELEICLTRGNKSICENPIGEVVGGINHLKKLAIAVNSNKTVSVTDAGLVVQSEPSDSSLVEQVFQKRLKKYTQTGNTNNELDSDEDFNICDLFD